MGRTVRIEGKPVTYSEKTSIGDIKKKIDSWGKADVIIYTDEPGEQYTLNDEDTVGALPENAPLARQSTDGKVWG